MSGVGTIAQPHNRPPEALHARLAVQRCRSCGRHPNYPRIRCPFCFGELEWSSNDGIGTIVDLAIVHRPDAARYDEYVPIVMAHIAIADGPEIIATIIGAGRLSASVGGRVSLSTQPWWSTLPQFELMP